jgi:hypothetical protein
VAKRLALVYETDPMKGEFDSLIVVPTYSISSKDPLTVDLNFMVEGGFTFEYLSDITYPFYKESSELRFLRYTFTDDKNGKVESSLRFVPNKCSVGEVELLAQFNKIKKEGNLENHVGGEFMKLSFTCFLNKANPHYEMIKKESIEASGESLFPGNYYVYVVYLDRFIINLTPR